MFLRLVWLLVKEYLIETRGKEGKMSAQEEVSEVDAEAGTDGDPNTNLVEPAIILAVAVALIALGFILFIEPDWLTASVLQ
ncbi:hypothetical protein A2837_02230 [Candidatus Kaiserbacteria bacterium RIFCSPHIGHO2_01_FULL_46_22]|uniref:Uncharacterized protein n=1 Tax=Candidatus Kaiserbacteria bacterium RIFCSPHIGHO2_01_FULL_46_22 TaxID=1798475 RepID=A0A1F6BYL5_9BACT|nr:MAG: hypothetical protein A2837_02230 [Candidatus Kaiserbacteria bacterium RIFCSPHIGHO2_01_FULL_46_22]